jgi:hypothetical protein
MSQEDWDEITARIWWLGSLWLIYIWRHEIFTAAVAAWAFLGPWGCLGAVFLASGIHEWRQDRRRP